MPLPSQPHVLPQANSASGAVVTAPNNGPRPPAFPVPWWLLSATGLSLLLLAGCRSTPPAAPEPGLVAQANQTSRLAARQTRLGQWKAAQEAWTQAADLYALLNQQDREAVARHNLAQALRQQGELEAARIQIQEAITLNQALQGQDPWWRNQIALLQLERALGETNALAARYKELLPQSSQIQDPNARALFLNEAGLWHLQHDRAAEANTAFIQAVQGFKRSGDSAGTAVALANQALALEKLEQFPAAQETWLGAQKEFERVGDPGGIATAMTGQGRVLLRENRDLGRAEDLLRRAARNFRQLGHTAACAAALDLRREALRLQGKPDEDKAAP